MEPNQDLNSATDLYKKNLPPPKIENNLKLPSGKTVAYGIAATVLSCNVPLTLVGGGLVATAHLINGIWNAAKLGVQLVSLNLNEKKISNLSKEQNSSEALDQLNLLINGQKSDIEKTKADIKHNLHHFVGGFLSAVPFCGLLMSDAYLGAVKGHSYRFGISKNILENPDTYIPTFLIKSSVEKNFYPGKDLDSPNIDTPVNYEKKEIAVDRGSKESHTVTCHISLSYKEAPAGPTMILFHGNSQVGPELVKEAEAYKDAGWNVVLMTMGGYPGSDPTITTNEETTIQDVNAVLRYLDEQKVQNIGVHGMSIGGSLAMHATKLSNKISVVVLDKPFDNVANVAVNVVKNVVDSSLLPSGLVRSVVNAGFPKGKPVHGVNDIYGNPYHTDGCDNVEKIKDFKGPIVLIKGDEDDFMGSKKDESGVFQSNFTDTLAKAYQGDKLRHMTDFNEHLPIGINIESIIQETSALKPNVKILKK